MSYNYPVHQGFYNPGYYANPVYSSSYYGWSSMPRPAVVGMGSEHFAQTAALPRSTPHQPAALDLLPKDSLNLAEAAPRPATRKLVDAKAPNPFTTTGLRYGGFVNEFYEAFVSFLGGHDEMKELKKVVSQIKAGEETLPSVSKKLGDLVKGAENTSPLNGVKDLLKDIDAKKVDLPTASKRLQAHIKEVEKFSLKGALRGLAYNAVLVYCAVDAAFVGTKRYFQAKESGDFDELAKVKGIQAGIGEGIFQGMASYWLPALTINKVIHPWGEGLGEKVAHNLAHKEGTAVPKMLTRLAKTKGGLFGAVTATVLSLAAIPLMIKVYDPILHQVVKLGWHKPTQWWIDQKYGKQTDSAH